MLQVFLVVIEKNMLNATDLQKSRVMPPPRLGTHGPISDNNCMTGRPSEIVT